MPVSNPTSESVQPVDLLRLEKKLDQVLLLLTGDGAPERGLLMQVAQIRRFLGRLGFDENAQPIDERVRDLEQFRSLIGSVLTRWVMPVLVAETIALAGFVGGIVTHRITISF